MKIPLCRHDAGWAGEFATECSFLSRVLAACRCQIEHVGSTSIPGMIAKPIIDVLVGIRDETDLDVARDALVTSGKYIYFRAYEAAHPLRRFFVKPRPHASTFAGSSVDRIDWDREIPISDRHFHIHVVQRGSPYWGAMLAVRDLLRSSACEREAYATLKHELAANEWPSTKQYAEAKDAFVTGLLTRAGLSGQRNSSAL